MNKLLTTILSFFVFGYSMAQYKPSEIFLKSGEKIIAKGKLKSDYIKYKTENKGKPEKIYFNEIDSILMDLSGEEITTFKYKKLKNKYEKILVSVTLLGRMNLYTMNSKQTEVFAPSGLYGNTVGFSNSVIKSSYFIERDGENEIIPINSSGIFGFNYKKEALKYFKDCELLIKRIQQKKIKKDDILGMVEFYNNECN